MVTLGYYGSTLMIISVNLLTLFINSSQSSSSFRSYLHRECSASSSSSYSPSGSTCIAINDLYLDSSCLATNSCNVFAIFKVTQASRTRYISDDLKLSLYRFGSKPKTKHSMYLYIRYGDQGTKYECIYTNSTVRGRIRMPYRDPIVDETGGTIDDEVLSCHWLLEGSIEDGIDPENSNNNHQIIDDSSSRWPRYGPNERIDLINWYNVSFELSSNGIVSTQPTNNLPIYRVKYLRDNCNKPGGSKFCYHWKNFERTWILVERWPQQNYLHVLLILNLNFTSIQLKFSPDNGFGDDYVVTCDNLSCRETIIFGSLSEPRPLPNRSSIMWNPVIRRDGPLTRIHFTLPLFFTLENIDFSLGSSFYINFAIIRNQRIDNIWTPRIDLNIRKTDIIKTSSIIDKKPEPAANKNRLYGSSTDADSMIVPLLTRINLAFYLFCFHLFIFH